MSLPFEGEPGTESLMRAIEIARQLAEASWERERKDAYERLGVPACATDALAALRTEFDAAVETAARNLDDNPFASVVHGALCFTVRTRIARIAASRSFGARLGLRPPRPDREADRSPRPAAVGGVGERRGVVVRWPALRGAGELDPDFAYPRSAHVIPTGTYRFPAAPAAASEPSMILV